MKSFSEHNWSLGPPSRTGYKLCLQQLICVQVCVKQRENPAAPRSLCAVITIIAMNVLGNKLLSLQLLELIQLWSAAAVVRNRQHLPWCSRDKQATLLCLPSFLSWGVSLTFPQSFCLNRRSVWVRHLVLSPQTVFFCSSGNVAAALVWKREAKLKVKDKKWVRTVLETWILHSLSNSLQRYWCFLSGIAGEKCLKMRTLPL